MHGQAFGDGQPNGGAPCQCGNQIRAGKVGQVPLVPYHRPGDPAVGEWVARCIVARRNAGKPIRAVMLDRLGPNVWHDSPAQASGVLEELEETARLWLMTRPAPLDDASLEELRTTFRAIW